MKLFENYLISAVIFCFAVSALAQTPINITAEQKVKFKQDFQECVKQENVSEEDVKRLQKWQVQDASTGMKCLLTCFFEKFGILKENKIQEETALQKVTEIMGEERAKELLRRSRGIEVTERCETGFKIFEIVWNYQAF